MPHANPAFSRAEYDRRLAKTRSAMAAAGVNALFVQDPSNMAWLTGYEGWSFYVHQGVVVLHDADPIWWGRNQDANGARRTVWMSDDRIHGYADNYVQSTERHPMQDLAQLLVESGLGQARIGVELDNYYYSAKAHLTLAAELPQATLVDGNALVNWQRAVKSSEEIALMRKAARISEHMIDGVIERIEPGLRKNELVAQIYHDAISGVGEDWGDYAAIVPLLPSGSDAAAPHLTWDGAPFKSGECTFFELSGCYRRYHAPFCRSVFLGQPPDHLLRAEAALAEGLEAGLDAARAGVRYRAGVGRAARARRDRTRRAVRVSGGPQLSAGLGRTHHIFARGR
jgi:ectoine hydrolase